MGEKNLIIQDFDGETHNHIRGGCIASIIRHSGYAPGFFYGFRQTARETAVFTRVMGLFCVDIFGRGSWNLGFSSAVIVEPEDDTYS